MVSNSICNTDISIENMLIEEYYLHSNIMDIHRQIWNSILDTCVLWHQDNVEFEISTKAVKQLPKRLLYLSYTYYIQGQYNMCVQILSIVIDMLGSISLDDINEEPYLFLKRHSAIADAAYQASVCKLSIYEKCETNGLHRLCWEVYEQICSTEQLEKIENARIRRKELYD